MSVKKEYTGFNSRTFRANGDRCRVQMTQLWPGMTPRVSVWIGDLLLSTGYFNGLSYIEDQFDKFDATCFRQIKDEINVCCSEMVV